MVIFRTSVIFNIMSMEMKLSGPNHGSPNYYFDGPLLMSTYHEVDGVSLEINDAIWGKCFIGDEERDVVFKELFSNPLVVRSMGIEQLTLSPEYSTIPNTGAFSRFEHIWGSVVFVRKMIEKSPELQNLSEREKLVLELRTFVSDLGHTAFSHMGDWIMQGFGGAENFHDEELPLLMKAGGVNKILEESSYKIKPEEVIFPDVEDWIETGSPDLCVDRVDYGVREIQRWMYQMADTTLIATPDAFEVRNGQLVMTSKRAAEEYFRGFSLLPTEHWQEPVHRAQLKLLEGMIKRSIMIGDTVASSTVDEELHPRDVMYTVDSDITRDFRLADELQWTLDPLLRRVATDQRTIFAQQRASQLRSYFSSYGGENKWTFPTPGEAIEYGFHSWRSLNNPVVEVIPVNDVHNVSPDEIKDFKNNNYTIDVPLQELKPRYVDPLFIDSDNEVVRLSEVDTRYKGLIEQQALVMRQQFIGRVLLHPEYKAIVERELEEGEKEFAHAMTRARLSIDGLARIIKGSSYLAIPFRIPHLEKSYNLI